MKRVLLLILIGIACSKRSQPAATIERTYPMTATIVSRDPVKNTVNLDNKEVPGEMAAMKMDYELRGAKVTELPPNGTAVVVNGSYYVSDVRTKK
jgi:hypothetical protein